MEREPENKDINGSLQEARDKLNEKQNKGTSSKKKSAPKGEKGAGFKRVAIEEDSDEEEEQKPGTSKELLENEAKASNDKENN